MTSQGKNGGHGWYRTSDPCDVNTEDGAVCRGEHLSRAVLLGGTVREQTAILDSLRRSCVGVDARHDDPPDKLKAPDPAATGSRANYQAAAWLSHYSATYPAQAIGVVAFGIMARLARAGIA